MRQQELLMAWVLSLPNLTFYTLLWQKYLTFFALICTDSNWIYVFCISTNQHKNGGSKNPSPNSLQTLLNYVICPSWSPAIWLTFSCFTALTRIYWASSYRDPRHLICPKLIVTVFQIMVTVAAKMSAKKMYLYLPLL